MRKEIIQAIKKLRHQRALTASLEASIENYLKLHYVHLDLIEKYGGNKY